MESNNNDYENLLFYFAYKTFINTADEIIEDPEKHLLTQKELLAAEGGATGLLTQVGAVLVGHAVLFAMRPTTLTYLRRAQLRPLEWALVGGVSLFSY